MKTSLSRLLRVRHWAHFLVLPLASAELDPPSLRGALALLRGVVLAALVLAFGYLANAISDRAMDLDPAKNPLAQRHDVDERRLHALLILLAAVALALSLTAPALVIAATAAGLLAGWAYSMGARLKARPFVGTLMNAVYFAPLLLLGAGTTWPPPRLSSLGLAFVALLLQNQLLHEAADAAEDRGGGVRTTFLVVGPGGAALIAAGCGVAVLGVTLDLVVARQLPSAWALGAAPYVVLFPSLLALLGRSRAWMARLRVTQRWAAVASGALLLALAL